MNNIIIKYKLFESNWDETHANIITIVTDSLYEIFDEFNISEGFGTYNWSVVGGSILIRFPHEHKDIIMSRISKIKPTIDYRISPHKIYYTSNRWNNIISVGIRYHKTKNEIHKAI